MNFHLWSLILSGISVITYSSHRSRLAKYSAKHSVGVIGRLHFALVFHFPYVHNRQLQLPYIQMKKAFHVEPHRYYVVRKSWKLNTEQFTKNYSHLSEHLQTNKAVTNSDTNVNNESLCNVGNTDKKLSVVRHESTAASLPHSRSMHVCCGFKRTNICCNHICRCRVRAVRSSGPNFKSLITRVQSYTHILGVHLVWWRL